MTVQKIILTNMVINGSFKNGVAGWQVGAANFTVVNGVANLVPTSQGGNIYQHLGKVASHVIYARCLQNAYAGCTNGYFNVYESTTGNNIDHAPVLTRLGSLTKLSQRFTTSALNTNLTIAVMDWTPSGWGLVTADDILVIDLTESFGAGKEPTKEWCDANIKYFDREAYTSLLSNSDFSNGGTDWLSTLASSFTVSNCIATFVASGQYGRIYNSKKMNSVVGDKLYLCAKIKQPYDGAVLIGFGLASDGSSAAVVVGSVYTPGVFTRASTVYTAAYADLYFAIYNWGTTYNVQIVAKEAFVLNLTKIFGAGYEPTKEWCDDNISYQNGSYIIYYTDGMQINDITLSPSTVNVNQSFALTAVIVEGAEFSERVSPYCGDVICGEDLYTSSYTEI